MIARDSVERTLFVAASPEIVFSFFTDADKLLLWTGEQARVDPRPGGSFRVKFDRRGVANGTYLDVEPFERILLSWGWEGDEAVPPGSSKVEVTFRQRGRGTVVSLRHYDLPGDIEGHEGGWDYCLPRLAAAIRDTMIH